MADTEREAPKSRAEALAYINERPVLLSLLYDLDLMPEQVAEDSEDEEDMFKIADHWFANELESAALDAAGRRDAARYRWLRSGQPGCYNRVMIHAGEGLDRAVDEAINADLAKIPGAIDPRL